MPRDVLGSLVTATTANCTKLAKLVREQEVQAQTHALQASLAGIREDDLHTGASTLVPLLANARSLPFTEAGHVITEDEAATFANVLKLGDLSIATYLVWAMMRGRRERLPTHILLRIVSFYFERLKAIVLNPNIEGSKALDWIHYNFAVPHTKILNDIINLVGGAESSAGRSSSGNRSNHGHNRCRDYPWY